MRSDAEIIDKSWSLISVRGWTKSSASLTLRRLAVFLVYAASFNGVTLWSGGLAS